MMQIFPAGRLKVNKIAGKTSSGSKISSETGCAREFDKNDNTKPVVRKEYAGCSTLPVHSASKTALIAETTPFVVIDASSDIVLLKDMLMTSAPAFIALRTVLGHS